MSRKAYPLAPDENMPNGVARYEQRRARVYYGDDLDLSRSCKIASTSVLGPKLFVGADSIITHSVLGESVTIGASCNISGSYIFEGATIGDNCSIRDSVIGEHARIAAGSTIERGSLVAAGVELGSASRLDGHRVSLEEPTEEVEVTGASCESASLSAMSA